MAMTLHYACSYEESLELPRLVYANFLKSLVKIYPCYETEGYRGKVHLNFHLELLASGLLKLYLLDSMS